MRCQQYEFSFVDLEDRNRILYLELCVYCLEFRVLKNLPGPSMCSLHFLYNVPQSFILTMKALTPTTLYCTLNTHD